MITTIKHSTPNSQVPEWHARFLAMLPAIYRAAKIGFRKVHPELRAELVAELIANCAAAYARLAERGREDIAYPSALAAFALAQVRVGRKVGASLRINDCLSSYAQHRRGFQVERLDQFNPVEEEWREILIEDRRASPADLAAARIDFGQWLREMPSRLRKIAKFLATGETTSAAARRFAVSPARISQLRREFRTSWLEFHGELPTATGGAAC